jgi:hypothetical protein
MCLVGDRQQHAERVDAAAIHSDRVQQTLNKPREQIIVHAAGAPKEFAASGPESVLGYFHMTAEREGATLIHG